MILLATVALAIAALALGGTVVVYWVRLRWEDTETGRHLMASTVASLLLVVAVSVEHLRANPNPVGDLVVAVAALHVAYVAVWRTRLVVRPPRGRKE